MRAAAYACALLGALFASGCGRDLGTSKSDRKPNVLLVTLDTTRRDHFGCYGDTRNLTPAFDALAAGGARFDQAFSSAAATPVSHASILTGLAPFQHQVRVIAASAGYRLPDQIPTLATLLKAGGWQTAAFLSSFTVSDYYGFERGFDEFDSGVKPGESGFTPDRQGKMRWDVQRDQRRSDETTDHFLKWLDRAGAAPFAAWIHYWDPHDDVLKPPVEQLAKHPPTAPTPVAARNALYEAEIAYVDMQFARVIAALRQKGLYDNTLIVVTADHGEGLGDHGWQFHRLLYQEQIHVPLIVKPPTATPRSAIANVVSSVDILPTVLDYLELAHRPKTFGRSLRPLIEGRGDASHIAYAEQLNKFDLNSNLTKQRAQDGLLYGIVEGDWKLIYNDEFPDASQLYDLKSDPHELKNVFAQETERAAALKGRLEGLNPFRRTPFEAGEVDPAAMKALEALGYAGDADGQDAQPQSRRTTSRPASQP